MEPKPRYEQALEYEQRDEFATAFVLYRECLSCAAYHQGDILFKCGWCLERIGNSVRPGKAGQRELEDTMPS
jgi:hypothetical protein